MIDLKFSPAFPMWTWMVCAQPEIYLFDDVPKKKDRQIDRRKEGSERKQCL